MDRVLRKPRAPWGWVGRGDGDEGWVGEEKEKLNGRTWRERSEGMEEGQWDWGKVREGGGLGRERKGLVREGQGK